MPTARFISQHSLFLLFFMCSTLFAQEAQAQTYSLADLIAQMEEENIDLKNAQLQIESAELDVTMASLNRLPNLNGSASGNLNAGRSIDPFENTFTNNTNLSSNFGLNSSVNLFNGGQLTQRKRLAETTLERTKTQWEELKNTMGIQIARAYLETVMNKEIWDNATENKQATEKELERVSAQLQAGTVPRGRVYEVEAQLAVDEQNMLNAQYNFERSKLSVFQMINTRDMEGKSLQYPSPSTLDISSEIYDVQSVYTQAITHLPQFRRATLQTEEALINTKIAQGAMMPSLRFGGSIGTLTSDQAVTRSITDTTEIVIGRTASNELVFQPSFNFTSNTTPFRQQIENNFNKTLFLSLQVPIFNGLSGKLNTEKAEIAVLQTNLQKQTIELQTYQEVQSAILEARQAYAAFTATEKSLQSAKENLDYAQKRLDLEAISIYDFRQIRNQFLAAESNHIRAKYNVVFTRMVVEFYKKGRFLI